MSEFFYIPLAVGLAIAIPYTAYKAYNRWLNYGIQKAVNAQIIHDYTSCIVTTACPCNREMVNIPYHPQASKEFQCHKCKSQCVYNVEFKTAVKG